jgi:Na+:H+ antiporter
VSGYDSRGEVGLILAGIGSTLTLPNAHGVKEPVVGSVTFGAVVLMVITTTLITPPLLKWTMGVRSGSLREVRTTTFLHEPD